MTDEVEFVRRLQRRFSAGGSVRCGIGDDGAVLDVTRHGRQVIVTDMLLDGVHFHLAEVSAELVGRKAVAVNLSDLAAMGCSADAAFVSIAVSNSIRTPDSFLRRLYDGIEALADQFSFVLAGGDTNAWNGPFAINVCMTGTPFDRDPMLRSGARAGDIIYVTGPLGGSLKSGRHLTFEPRIDMAKWIMENAVPSAMMDISDGLSLDLHRLLEASHCGAVVNAAQVPIHDDVRADLDASTRLQRALSDGEDFELLVTIPPTQRGCIQSAVADGRLTEIGVITDVVHQLLLRDSSRNEMEVVPSGWQHL